MNNGAFGENFPYSNFHDLNMDWIIKIAKDFLDQYTHIQEVIANGEESLTNLTTEGLEQLQEKADALETLLQQWYDTHSEDIADQLASALDDLNAQLTLNLNSFIQQANQKTQDSIASIPSDYSTLAQDVENLKANNSFNIAPIKNGSATNRGITFDWSGDGRSCHVHGTQSGSGSSTDNLYDNHTLMPVGFTPGETYYVNFDAPSTMRLQVNGFTADDSLVVIYPGVPGAGTFTIPSNIVGLNIRLLVTTGATIDTTVYPIIRTSLSNAELSYNQTDLGPQVAALERNVAELQTNTLSMNFSSASNLNTTSMWERGSISPTTGENVVSSGRIRTITYLPTNIATMKLPNDSRGFFIVGYDEQGTFIGVYNSDGIWTIDQGTGYTEFNFSRIYSKYNNMRLRIYLYSRDGQDITLDEAQYIEMQSIYNQLINPVKIRIMQNNIGQFNFGLNGGYSGTDLGLKLSNYRKLMYKYHPDIITLQEYRTYVNADDTANANNVIFSWVKPYMSYEEHGYVVFSNYATDNFRHTYLHSDGDYPARMVYGTITINNKEVAIGTAALNALGGSSDAAMKTRALTKMVNLLAPYETAIIGIDANVESEAEANAVKTFLKTNGFQMANWDYIGYLPTYNPSNPIYKCIDNIFIKGKALFQNVEVVPDSEYNNLLSDHLPIIADILLYK